MSVAHVKEMVDEMQNDFLHPELIQDNKLHFTVDGKIYRVRMPNQLELLEAEKNKNAYQVMLLKSENSITLKKLKKLLKESQDIDVDALEKDLKSYEEKVLKVYDKLVKRQDEDKEGIDADKAELSVLKKERNELIDEISKHTTPAIEVQSENYFMSYLTSVCTEKNVEKENEIVWEKVWNTFDNYLTCEDSSVKYYGMGYLTHLMMSIR